MSNSESMPTGANTRIAGDELLSKPEIEVGPPDWETAIILQRHGRYDNRFPESWVVQTDEEKGSLGRLTPEGIDESSNIASQRIRGYIEDLGDKVDFAVVASPTFWVDIPEFGQRAVETGEIIANEIAKQLKEAGLSDEQLLSLDPRAPENKVKTSPNLVESKMFRDKVFTGYLREKYDGQGRAFWDSYNADDDHNERTSRDVEGSPETADRVGRTINTYANWANQRHQRHPDRKTVIFMVSHHEAIEPYALRTIGTLPGEFEPQYNDGLTIMVDGAGVGHTEVAGREIELPILANTKKS